MAYFNLEETKRRVEKVKESFGRNSGLRNHLL